MKSIKELLQAKRDGAAWSGEEIHYFIAGVSGGEVSSAQAAAFLMAACTRGLSEQEIADLTLAMAHSGDMIRPGLSDRPYVDKHSTGGVGDKVSIMLAPLAACCGLAVPMISGRGLGHTGGTVDKLESVPGLRMMLTHEEVEALLSHHHLVMAAQTPHLAPADRLLYALRDVTGTVENIGLLTSSILSKKIAENLSGLVMDVKVGRGAFMKDMAGAKALAASIQRVASLAGLHTQVVISRMDVPLGRSVGNWVEVVECEKALQSPDSCSQDLYELTLELVTRMVMLGFPGITLDEAGDRVRHVWQSGQAHTELMRMIERQGGDYALGERHFTACPTKDVVAVRSGIVNDIDAMTVALGILHAGGGRKKETDSIDPFVGIVHHVRLGSKVERGDRLATVSASSADKLDVLHETVLQSMLITETAPVFLEPSVIVQRC